MFNYSRITAWIALLSFATTPLLPFAQAVQHSRRVSTQAPQEAPDPSAVDGASSTELAPGFLIQLSSPQDAKINGNYRIQPDGKIDLPYSKVIDTKGLHLGGFRQELARAYAGYFKGVPLVSAVIKQKRYWVEVLGLVAKPGEYLLKQDSPLDEIISLAGGITEDLNFGFARIVQGSKTSWVDLSEYYKGHETEVPIWQGNDRIFFQKERPEFTADPLDAESARKVQMLGELRQPGELTYRREADIYYYLVKTGGPTTSADLDKVELIRPDKDGGARKRISIGPINEVKLVQGGDILIFYPQRTSTFEKTLAITSIFTSILTATILAIVAVRQNSK